MMGGLEGGCLKCVGDGVSMACCHRGTPPGSASSGEADQYFVCAELLRLAGRSIYLHVVYPRDVGGVAYHRLVRRQQGVSLARSWPLVVPQVPKWRPRVHLKTGGGLRSAYNPTLSWTQASAETSGTARGWGGGAAHLPHLLSLGRPVGCHVPTGSYAPSCRLQPTSPSPPGPPSL